MKKINKVMGKVINNTINSNLGSDVIDSEKILGIYINRINYEIACNDIVYEKTS